MRQSSTAVSDTFTCKGCGAALTYRGFGPHPKWCSGRCRKAQYGTPCVDCGAMTSGSEGRREARCRPCGQKLASRLGGATRAVKRRARWDSIAADYLAGVSLTDIAARHGLSGAAPLARELFDMREEGYELPHRRSTYGGVTYPEHQEATA